MEPLGEREDGLLDSFFSLRRDLIRGNPNDFSVFPNDDAATRAPMFLQSPSHTSAHTYL